ncbi:MAG TPA: ABC transporter ATP-binding protein [Pirellulaceae bacterium]|jgi:ATP-binding cassette subfamily B protein/subfamily B ATP-binding cassette protein MsbA
MTEQFHSDISSSTSAAARQPRSSRLRYLKFVGDYKARRLDDISEGKNGEEKSEEKKAEKEQSKGLAAFGLKKGKRREYLREYMAWLWPYRFAVVTLAILALMTAGLEMAEPLFMRFIVDRVLLNTGLEAATRLAYLQMAGAFFLVVVIVSHGIGVVKDYRQRILNIRVMLSLRKSLFDRLVHLPLSRLWDMKTGGILSRLSGDVDTTTGLLQMAIVSPAISILRLAIAVGILFTLNARLAFMALAIIPGAMLMSFVFARRIRPIYRAVRKDVEVIDGRVGETFSGIRVVRAFGREMRETFEYLAGRHTVLRKELFAHRRELVLWTSWGLLVSGVNVVIVWYGGYLNLVGRASVGDIMAFQWYTFLLLNPVWNIVNSFSELQRSLAAMERVFEVLAMGVDMPDKPNAVDAPAVVEEIRMENVEFEYREGRPVVCDFNVFVPGGSVVALVGRSGAGKTTVTDLVARFHDPTRGRIVLNGTDIRDFRLRSYRDLLAIVQQDVFLFDGSVRDNIAYGRHSASDEEVIDAAMRANAHEFIDRLPEKYNTFIGERGVKLSGGQQQRLAIARAILAKPQILILDEATSNLDTESEQLIQASMATLLSGRTTFVIAHRLSTIRRADLILLMEDGRIIERGTHQELMSAGGVYYDMVVRQMTSDEQTVG